jgi:hypothetical protein
MIMGLILFGNANPQPLFKVRRLLSPSELGTSGVKRSIKQHKNVLQNSLLRLLKVNNRHSLVALVCLKIMNAKSGDVIDGVAGILAPTEINEIKNNFVESMGVIWCQQLIPGIKPHEYMFIETTSKKFSFKVYRGSEVFLVSTKTLGKYNKNLNPDAIMREIDGNTDLYRKWGNEVPYHVLECIQDSTPIVGAIKAIMKYYPSAVKVSANDLSNVIRQLTSNNAILENPSQSIIDLVMSDTSTAKQYEQTEEITATMINSIFSKILISKSEEDPRYNELYDDAMQNNIKLLKFDLKSDGTITYSLHDSKNSKGTASLREKSGERLILTVA